MVYSNIKSDIQNLNISKNVIIIAGRVFIEYQCMCNTFSISHPLLLPLRVHTSLGALGSKQKSDLTFTALPKVLTVHHSSSASTTKDGEVHVEGTRDLEGAVPAATEMSPCTQWSLTPLFPSMEDAIGFYFIFLTNLDVSSVGSFEGSISLLL